MDASSESPVKRSRGRPRKIVFPIEPVEPTKPKRGRGRPRKIVYPNEPIKPTKPKVDPANPPRTNEQIGSSRSVPHADFNNAPMGDRYSESSRARNVDHAVLSPEEASFKDPNDTFKTTLQSEHTSTQAITDTDFASDDDDSEDDDYICESDTNDEEILARYIGNIDSDELEYLVHDQELPVDDETHQLPTLYYPTLKNRLYTFMRSITIQNIYKICAYIFLFSIVIFLVNQLGQHQSNVRRNGYCSSFDNVPDNTINHSCIPCPPHADCAYGQLLCHPLYRSHRSTLNRLLNIVWPTPKKCIKDPVMLKHAKKMETKILNYLARRQGDFQCKQYKLRNGKHPVDFEPVRTHVDLIMDTLKPSFSLPVAHNQDHQVGLDHLMELALNLTIHNPRVLLWDNGSYLGINYAKYSFGCWWWVKLSNLPLFLIIGAPLLLGIYILYTIWIKKKRQVNVITDKALDLLKEKRRQHMESGGSQGPGCSGNYLRLHILPGTDHNSIDIWKRVLRNLQQHPGIRKGYTDENGEILQYFEWL